MLLKNQREITMARIGVTYIDIAEAAEKIKTQGKEPTVDRVREQLGTGSKSTIAPYLKRWKNKSQVDIDNSGLPRDLIEVVKSLHERIQDSATQKIEAFKNTLNAEIAVSKQKLIDSEKIIDHLSNQNTTLEKSLETAEQNNDSLMQSNTELKSSIEKITFENEQTLSRVEEYKATIHELKQETKDIREHFEHYQQHIAGDRQLEREQFQLTIDQLQGQNKELSLRNSENDNTIKELGHNKQTDQEKIEKLQAENQTFQSKVEQQSSEISQLQSQLSALNVKNEQLTDDNAKMKADFDKISAENTGSLQEIKHLNQFLDKTKAELGEARDKIAIQDNDFKILLQEKSVIQGQFKQLQNSL